MTRLADWEQRFVAVMPDVLSQPFAWGSADCAHLMASSVEACHGADHPVLADLSRYKTKAGALRLLKAGGGLSAMLARHFEEVPLLVAQTGDLGVLVVDGVEAGLVVIDGQAVGKGEHAPHYRMPVRAMTRAFRV
ncbi:MAG: hypothetical protein KIS86_14990 [Devosia sp.]|nr:hypothetical protein [Devosia sp.]